MNKLKTKQMERICIVEGVRTPMCKAGSELSSVSADELGVYTVKHLIQKTNIDKSLIDNVIFGCVAMPMNAPNIARVIALKSGLPISLPAYSIHRNCASGMDAIIAACDRIELGKNKMIIAGGAESMSNIPLVYRKSAVKKFTKLATSRTFSDKLKSMLSFRFSDFSPVISLIQGLTDPVTGNIMGKTAEILAREFNISRLEQDQYALRSHLKSTAALHDGIFAEEIVPVPVKPKYNYIVDDNGINKKITLEKLSSKRPYFDRVDGTVTVANSCQVTDGAAAVIVTTETEAKKHGLNILGYINHHTEAALSPDRMGLGPIYAINKIIDKSGLKVSDYDLFEINEAFAAQILANQKALGSKLFSEKFLNKREALGEIPDDKLNVNGGAIALGHPVGMSGTRIVIHLLKEMNRRNLERGIAAICVGGGQGVAIDLSLS
jgi:acetyl-CoA C-acetyltransferase/acetyl-CoA acyltransferase